jgi:hypothetical protein
MFRSSWLQNVLGLVPSHEDRCRQAARQRHSVHLMLEQLEDRVVPSGGNPRADALKSIPFYAVP